jgi:hypothetical protein
VAIGMANSTSNRVVFMIGSNLRRRCFRLDRESHGGRRIRFSSSSGRLSMPRAKSGRIEDRPFRYYFFPSNRRLSRFSAGVKSACFRAFSRIRRIVPKAELLVFHAFLAIEKSEMPFSRELSRFSVANCFRLKCGAARFFRVFVFRFRSFCIPFRSSILLLFYPAFFTIIQHGGTEDTET